MKEETPSRQGWEEAVSGGRGRAGGEREKQKDWVCRSRVTVEGTAGCKGRRDFQKDTCGGAAAGERRQPGGFTAGGCHAMTSAKTPARLALALLTPPPPPPRTPRNRPSVCTVGEDASADNVLAFILFLFYFFSSPSPDSENGFETRN